MKIIFIIGEPGSGKTTLMRRFMEEVGGFEPHFKEYPLIDYHRSGDIFVLGKYEEGELFAGTDRLSMACQPNAVKFLSELRDESVVLIEGDRLGNRSFIEDCFSKYPTLIVYLKTSSDTREQRFSERGSDQNEQFLRSRETKLKNLRSNFELMTITHEFRNENSVDQSNIINFMKGQI